MESTILLQTRKVFCSFLIVAFAVLAVQNNVARAGMIGTQDVLNSQASQDARDRVAGFLQRSDVQQAMIAQGVSPAEVEQRVASLTDQEINQLAGKIDNLPAGAGLGTVVGAIVFIFVLLLVTDILGFTKVYPFTKSVQ